MEQELTVLHVVYNRRKRNTNAITKSQRTTI